MAAFIFPMMRLLQPRMLISLEVSDEVGEQCTDLIFLSVGTAPSTHLSSPTTGQVVELGENLLFAGSLTDNDELSTGLTMSWVSNLDGEFSSQGSDSNGQISFYYNGLSAGDHSITATATDSNGLTSSQSFTLTVNTPPEVPTLSLLPVAPTTVDNLLVTAASSDVEGDTIGYSYTWMLNGSPTNQSTASVSSADTSKGDLWAVQVTPNDGYHDGQTAEVSVIIGIWSH